MSSYQVLVDPILDLPDRQVNFLRKIIEEIQITEVM